MRFVAWTLSMGIFGFGLAPDYAVSGESTGLSLGTRAPGFTLKDQGGKERSLGEFLKKGKVALVFYRSASW